MFDERDPLTDKIYGALMMHHQETLRDQFAMAALTGILASPNTVATAGATAEGVTQACSEMAYLQADAMLAGRLEAQEQTNDHPR